MHVIMHKECHVTKRGTLKCPKPIFKNNYSDERIYTIDDVKSRKRLGTDLLFRSPVLSDDVTVVDSKTYGRADVKSASRSMPSMISIVRNKNKEEGIRTALDKIGGMCSIVKKDDLVAIKLNICGGTSTIDGTYTPKDTASIVGSMVRECGGKPIFFDSSMIWTDMYPIAKDEGYIDWAKNKKEILKDLNNPKKIPWVKFDYGKDTIVGIGNASRLLIDADIIINVPVMKTHLLSSVTMGMKNMYGAYPEADKGKYHAKGLNESIMTINRAFTPNLTIIDGSVGCDGGGPLSCDPIKPSYDTYIASTDVVCADALASRLIGHKNPLTIEHVRLGHQNGVGNALCYEDNGIEFDDNNKIKDLPSHEKDGEWLIVTPEFADQMEKNMEILGISQGGADFMNVASDVFLGGFAWYGGGFMPSIWRIALKSQDNLGKRFKYKPKKPFLHEHEMNDENEFIYPR